MQIYINQGCQDFSTLNNQILKIYSLFTILNIVKSKNKVLLKKIGLLQTFKNGLKYLILFYSLENNIFLRNYMTLSFLTVTNKNYKVGFTA